MIMTENLLRKHRNLLRKKTELIKPTERGEDGRSLYTYTIKIKVTRKRRMSFYARVRGESHPDFFKLTQARARELLASVSVSSALKCEPIHKGMRKDEMPWVVCRKTRGLSQAIFLFVFYMKFGFLPKMPPDEINRAPRRWPWSLSRWSGHRASSRRRGGGRAPSAVQAR